MTNTASSPNDLLDQQIADRIPLYQGVIFDMDGTLCDSEPMHHLAHNKHLQSLGFKPLPTSVLESYAGLPGITSFENILNRLEQSGEITPERRAQDPQLNLETLCAGKLNIYEKECMPQVPAFPRMIEVVKACAARGQRVALATSSPRSQADYLLGRFGIIDCFDSIITGNMVENGKPHPDIFLLAAQSHNLPCTQCLIFEDGAHGLAAAKAAKIDALKCDHGKFVQFFPNASAN